MTAVPTADRLEVLRSRLSRVRRDLDRQTGEARAVALRGQEAVSQAAASAREVDVLQSASVVLSSVADERQAEVTRQVEGLVTHGLRTIFEEDLSFHLVSSVKGRQVTTEAVVRSTMASGEVVETPLLDSRGGGLASVVGFLLRLVLVLLTPSRQDPVLVLDETFAQVSEEYEPRLAEFIRELVDRTSAQVILVTHSSAYSDHADRVHRLAIRGGETVVTS